MAELRVLVVSDLLLYREGVQRLLGEHAPLESLPATSIADAPARIAVDEPGVVVLLLSPGLLAGPQLVSTARLLRERSPGTGLVVVSSNGDGLVRSLLETGPRGVAFLLDSHILGVEALVRAVQDVADGMVSMNAAAADSLIGRGHPGLSELTAREHDVLGELARGLNNTAIAEGLQLTVKTVEANVSSIFRKLGLDADMGQDRRLTSALIFLNGHA